MVNAFDTEVAKDVGIIPAIIYHYIQLWISHNETNGTNFYDGYYWTYNSISAFCKQFDYLTKSQIERALKTLEEKEYIKVGNYNRVSYDRTKWYADLKKGNAILENEKSISQNCEIHFSDLGNGIPENEKPIPNKNQLNTTNKETSSNRFVKPTVEEIQTYIQENGYSVDAERFFDYYESNGWYVGKKKMKDWKATVRYWERNSNDRKPKPTPPITDPTNPLGFR